MKQVNRLMKQAVATGVFPGAVLVVSQSDSIIFSKAYGYTDGSSRFPVTTYTVFDLASLTKPLATTLVVMKLLEENKLDLSDRLGSILPQFGNIGKGLITIRHLLCHNSGLPDYQPYYLELKNSPLESRTTILRDRLLELPLLHPIGEHTLYSDLGFMILRWIVETVSGRCLDHMAAEDIYRPLGLSDLFFIDQRLPSKDRSYAATEECPWRKKTLEGEVHDDNAWILGGVEGHAGLFGTAPDVNRLLGKMLTVYHGGASVLFLNQHILRRFFSRQPDSDRALGFDTPSLTDSSCGHLFSKHTIGHLGFTGTSFWVDLDKAVTVVLLTNRVHPTRENIRIRSFRPLLHDAVMEAATRQAGAG